MQPCPKCSTGWMHDSGAVGLSSAFHGEPIGAEAEITDSGKSCWSCGTWMPSEVKPKEIDTKQRTPEQLEPMQAIKMRCDDYFDRFKHTFKNELAKGRKFREIYREIKENNMDCPCLSWIRSAYMKWVESGFKHT